MPSLPHSQQAMNCVYCFLSLMKLCDSWVIMKILLMTMVMIRRHEYYLFRLSSRGPELLLPSSSLRTNDWHLLLLLMLWGLIGLVCVAMSFFRSSNTLSHKEQKYLLCRHWFVLILLFRLLVRILDSNRTYQYGCLAQDVFERIGEFA